MNEGSLLDAFRHTKRTTWSVILAIPGVCLILSVLHSLSFGSILVRISELTDGLLFPTLLHNLLVMCVILPILFGYARLKPIEVGLDWTKLNAALLTTFALWLIVQAAQVVAVLVMGTSLASLATPLNGSRLTGMLLSQLLGNALMENIAFRGFLVPQLLHRFETVRRLGTNGPLALAMIVASLVFTVCHLPFWILELQYEPLYMAYRFIFVFVMGVLFAVLYVRTHSLFLCIGLHAIMDRPTMLVDRIVSPSLLLIALMFVLIALGPWLRRNVWERRQPALVA